MILNVIHCPCNSLIRTTALCKRIDSCYGRTFADENRVADLRFSSRKTLRTLFTYSALAQRCGYASRVAEMQRVSLLGFSYLLVKTDSHLWHFVKREALLYAYPAPLLRQPFWPLMDRELGEHLKWCSTATHQSQGLVGALRFLSVRQINWVK